MPLKNGRFTPLERAFIEHMARTNDAQYAAAKAGYGAAAVRGYQLMANPAIKAAVLRDAERQLRDDLLPLALATHKRLLTDAATPAGAQLGAVKLAYDRTLGADEDRDSKEPSEMTYDELQRSIDELKTRQDELAGQAVDVTPDPPAPGVFD